MNSIEGAIFDSVVVLQKACAAQRSVFCRSGRHNEFDSFVFHSVILFDFDTKTKKGVVHCTVI